MSIGKQPREDAVVIGHGFSKRWYVPTIYGQERGNTRWVGDWIEFRAAGGQLCYSEDQTELTLTLPAGFKFGIRFQREDKPSEVAAG